MNFFEPYISENQRIELPILGEKGIQLSIKREDKIHPYVSGNKFRKLKYNFLEAKHQQKNTILTFGGAFSNHILATAVAGKLSGFKTIGIIRGDELGNNLPKTLSENPTLQKAVANDMTLHFVTREKYRTKNSERFINLLKEKFGDFYLVPEGGTNDLAIKGCEEILTKDDEKFDYICVAIGTGGTVSGLINASKQHQKILGFPALKGDFLQAEIKKYSEKENWELINNYHFGGYAKYNDDLVRFINEYKKKTGVLLDPIYTGKMLFGILDMVEKDYFQTGTSILAVHTGGFQGIEGFNKNLQKKNKKVIEVL